MQENVIVAIFNVPSEAYQAFSELKAHTQTVDSLIAQAVLVKKENGLLIPAESTDFTADSTEGAWTGGLIGAWLGMLGGPVGVLLGGSFGALIGSDAGAAQTVGEACLLENAAQKLTTAAPPSSFSRRKRMKPRWINSLPASAPWCCAATPPPCSRKCWPPPKPRLKSPARCATRGKNTKPPNAAKRWKPSRPS